MTLSEMSKILGLIFCIQIEQEKTSRYGSTRFDAWDGNEEPMFAYSLEVSRSTEELAQRNSFSNWPGIRGCLIMVV